MGVKIRSLSPGDEQEYDDDFDEDGEEAEEVGEEVQFDTEEVLGELAHRAIATGAGRSGWPPGRTGGGLCRLGADWGRTKPAPRRGARYPREATGPGAQVQCRGPACGRGARVPAP